MSVSEGMVATLRHFRDCKCVEPVKRVKGDARPQWIEHRFPIKGGISRRQAWVRDLMGPNPLIKRLRQAGEGYE